MPRSVLKEWVFELPFRMQSVLMSGMRGCDIARKDDPSKALTRALRPVLCNNADTSNTFMGNTTAAKDLVEKFLWDMDRYPTHFIAHLMHAAEIVGFKHPDPALRKWWLEFYHNVVKGLHVNPETEEQLDVRLGFTPDELKFIQEAKAKESLSQAERQAIKKKHVKWEAGTGTSHGGRDRDWSGGS